MTLLFLSTLAVCESEPVLDIVKKTMDAVQPAINEATKQFFKGQKRLGDTCNVRDCEVPWICYGNKCQECQTGQEKHLVDGLMCKFPKMCMPMPHDPSKKGCINPAEWVNCGGHYAASCNACPGGNGKDYCNGDCIWSVPAPAAAPAAAPSKALLEPHAATSAAASASEAPVYHTYISAPPAAAASEPPPTCVAKATTAAPPENTIDCSNKNSTICIGDRNCIWVWDGSGLDPAAKLPETEPAKTEAVDKLTKTGKCLVLESYLESSAVRERKKVNKLAGNDLDPDDDGASKRKGICNKHSSWGSDANKGVCEQENLMGVQCAWWDTKVLGGKCVAVSSTDVQGINGGTCLFPFYYGEVKYDGCTTAASTENQLWCKLDLRKLSKVGRYTAKDWDVCVDGAPESDGVEEDMDVLCLLKEKELRGKNLDCKEFAAATSKRKKTSYCVKYSTAAKKCCRAECNEAVHPVQPASPPGSLLKQRTTQSFLAADNWE